MNIAFFGSSLVSAYWNGAATYYRGILRALAARGHAITFYEPDAFGRQQHRDLADPPWATVVVYPPDAAQLHRVIERARGSDLVVKASGVGVNDELLEEAVFATKTSRSLVAYWDVDAPATLERMHADPDDALRRLVPRFDLVFTYGGGAKVVAGYERLGARACVPIYNALDRTTHHRVAPDARFTGTLGFLGNRLPDREARVDEFFFEAARALPEHELVLGGEGWADKQMPGNVRYVGHVFTADHNAFNTTPLAVLNVSRASMATYGYSPATRVFEAAGAAACIVTDAWDGIDDFLEPGREVLVAHDGGEVASLVRNLTPRCARTIGEAARARILAHHTYEHRALDVEAALGTRPSSTSRRLSFVVLGLSITSSWGNGHATTYRSLVRELVRRGHTVTFLERDVPWYAPHRDLDPDGHGRIALYKDVPELKQRFERLVRDADVVIVGSYVPEGIQVGRWVQETARGTTAFYDIDTPVTLAGIADGTCEYLSAAQIARYGLYLSFTGGPVLRRLATSYGSPCARALYCSVDPELYHPEATDPTWELGYMGTYSDDRQPALERYLLATARAEPDRAFVVAGAQYPASCTWPGNVTRIEHLAPQDHRAFYNRCGFALNLTRARMLEAGWSPSVRLFEAAACATPIISDPWPGLDELFAPDEEIVLAGSSEDVSRALHDLTPAARRDLGERARARVLAAHTSAHRVADLLRYVDEVR